jgi:ABC-type multidrug transport system ATPase subunit
MAALVPRPPASTVAWAPQQPAFPGWLDVECVAWLYGVELTDLCGRFAGLLLEELHGKRAGSLSVGQRQALSVALALALDAPLTILDEPFASLDFRRRVGLVRHLQACRAPHARGITLISSQSATDLLETCDWIVVMREGEYVFSGKVGHLADGTSSGAEARQRFEQALIGLLAAAAPLQG